MNSVTSFENAAAITHVSIADSLSTQEMVDLVSGTVTAIDGGDGFMWLTPPPKRTIENFWKGVMLMPDRSLFLGWLNGKVGGALQLIRPTKNAVACSFAAQLDTFFVADFAQGVGLGRQLLRLAEETARREGFRSLELHVRGDRHAAIELFEKEGFERWGTKPRYAFVDNVYIPGHYYSLALDKKDQ